jgi:cell division protein FtsQ
MASATLAMDTERSGRSERSGRTDDHGEAPGVPVDIRLMNAVAAVVYAGVAVALLLAAVGWLARLPVFTLEAIVLDGDLERSNVATIRANAAPRLSGNFFTLDLDNGRAAFESVPWVRRAVVQRVWPDRLHVTLEEHQARALWTSEDGNDRLVNSDGEVFEANVGDVEDEALPRFAGPPDAADRMLAMYQRLQPVLVPLDARIETLALSSRGSWRAEMGNGAAVVLGRGNGDEVLARAERFVRTLDQVTGHYQRPLEYADLRHGEGYAVRLRGVTTTLPAPVPAARR